MVRPLPRLRTLVPTLSKRIAARRYPARWGVACVALAIMACAPGIVLAQNVNIPFDVTAPTITTTAPIADYVERAVTEMNGEDRERVMTARAALLAPLAGAPAAKSQAFLAAYARELNERLIKVANGKSPHAKLNAAIVTLRAAEQTRSPALSALIAKLIADESPAVATFGIRAAGDVLVYALGNPAAAQNDVLIPAIVKAVADNPENDAIVFDAYQTLTKTLLDRAASEAAGAQNVANATPRLIEAVHTLMDVRVKQYEAGGIVEPAAEQAGVTLLTRQATWAQMTPAQQTRTVRLIVGVMNGAATQLVTLQAEGAATNRARQDAFRAAIRGAAQGLGVVGSIQNNKALIDATRAITTLGGASPAADYRRAADAAIAAFQTAFPDAGEAATAPAQ